MLLACRGDNYGFHFGANEKTRLRTQPVDFVSDGDDGTGLLCEEKFAEQTGEVQPERLRNSPSVGDIEQNLVCPRLARELDDFGFAGIEFFGKRNGGSFVGQRFDAEPAVADGTFVAAIAVWVAKSAEFLANRGGIRTRPYRWRRRSSRSMMARFEIGEVLLTTSIRDVMEGVLHGVVSRDVTLGEFAGECVMVERRHARGEAEAQPALRIVAAGEFDLHVPLAFARPERQGGQWQVVNIERDGH
ncbi:MAG TPA: hypothetical protein VMN36_16875, partial [Verrucomicrobiales bacterium]|nr:hypothetical protein [Verrucomicrobiales bacterium]